MNNTTSLPEEKANEFALDLRLRTTFVVLNAIALPLGVSLEYFLIMRLLKKAKKRLWDVLTLAMEGGGREQDRHL